MSAHYFQIRCDTKMCASRAHILYEKLFDKVFIEIGSIKKLLT